MSRPNPKTSRKGRQALSRGAAQGLATYRPPRPGATIHLYAMHLANQRAMTRDGE